MQGVKRVLSREDDLLVSSVFTDSMFSDLLEEMKAYKISNLDQLVEVWESGFCERKAVAGFLMDKSNLKHWQ